MTLTMREAHRHADRILELVRSGVPEQANDPVAQSWSRCLNEYRLDQSVHAHRARQCTRIRRDYRWLASGINFREQQCINTAEHLDEIIKAISRSRVAMRLKRYHQTPPGEGAARR